MTTPEAVRDDPPTGCIIVGAGPAGMVLALLLARQGVSVTLLEAHKDFEREFRGDTVHPSTLEVLDQLGLADRLLALPHGKMLALRLITSQGAITLGDLTRLPTRFPFVAMIPQARFLEFLAEEAKRSPALHLVLGANVQRLVEADGVVRGVRYRGADDVWHEVRAPLTVAADGRFSKVRSLAGLEPERTAPPMDVVWFRLPRRADDPADVGALFVRAGHFVILLERAEEWQVGYVILKGSYQHVRTEGIETVRRAVAETVPWLTNRVAALEDWRQVAVLSVESNRLPRWHKPGLLLIGDAAHVMSPVGGVGINVAIQDAVETANLLGPQLKAGTVTEADLAAVQRRREPAVKRVQTFQGFMQRNLAAPALRGEKDFRLPLLARLLMRVPVLRDLPVRLIALGIPRVRVRMENYS